MTESTASSTGRVKVDNARVDRLKKLYIDTKQVIDIERLRFMKETYEETAGYVNVIRRAKFLAHVLDNKTLYIDDNIFVGSIGSSLNAIYAFPEWQVEWMKQEKTVETAKTEEEREVYQWVLDYWDTRALYPRAHEIFVKKYKFDPTPAVDAGLFMDFNSWPGGGGNLDYKRVYNEGIASMIKDIEARQAALDMRLENASKLYFYEGCLIVLRSIVRYANRYAKLAREMAAKEKNAARKAELITIAEICEHVPEHPARNLREAIQASFFCHVIAELEQAGCGYSNGWLGQYLEPFYQRDKAAGLVGPEEASYMLKHFFIKLNEICYYYGQSISTLNSSDLGQTISIGGYNEAGDDATAEMDYCVLDADTYLHLPQPPVTLMYHDRLKGAFLEKAYDDIRAGAGKPQFVNADIATTRGLHIWGKAGMTLQEARRTCVAACVPTSMPNRTGNPVEGQHCLPKCFELALNNGVDPVSGKQIGPKTGDADKFNDFEELYQAFLGQLDFTMQSMRHFAHIGMMLAAEFLPVCWRSMLTGGCIERGTDVWSGGADFYNTSLITCQAVDAANCMLAVKQLVLEDKKLTMAQLKTALAADFKGHEAIQKMCLAAPKFGNDIPEADAVVRRIYDDNYKAYEKVGGSYISKDMFQVPDAYSKSVHNYFGLKCGALPNGRNAGVSFTDGAVSAQHGTDVKGPTALIASAARVIDAEAYTSSHMNMRLSPDQLKTRKGTDEVKNLVKTLMELGGSHIQFNVFDVNTLIDAKAHPENYPDLVIRVAGFSAFFTRLAPGMQDEIITRTLQEFEGKS